MKIGDKVTLTAGGVPMTVLSVNEKGVLCAWFESVEGMGFGSQLRRDNFPAEALILSQPSPSLPRGWTCTVCEDGALVTRADGTSVLVAAQSSAPHTTAGVRQD